MANAPLPEPDPRPYQCPQCATPIYEAVPFCPHCGARVELPKQAPGWGRIISSVVLVMVALVAGSVGACATVFLAGSRGDKELAGVTLAFLVPAALVVVACVFGIKALLKRK